MLWSLDPAQKQLVVQSAISPTKPALLGKIVRTEDMPTPTAGSCIEIAITIAPQKTPPANVPAELRHQVKNAGGAYRSRLVIVPDAERPGWFIRRMERIGFRVDAESIKVSPQCRVSLGSRGRSIPAVTIRATGTVKDSDSFTSAMRNGIGKGRNYGLGLLRVRNRPN